MKIPALLLAVTLLLTGCQTTQSPVVNGSIRNPAVIYSTPK